MYAECSYAECCYAECLSAIKLDLYNILSNLPQSVDFDQLFARGHAIGEQRERQTQSMTGLPTGASMAAGFPNGHNPTPFEIYSKEEAFKQAQQGAGISYEEKVQSYLVNIF